VLFALDIKVEGFVSKDASGRKSYTKGRVFKWDLEYGSMTLELLMKYLTTELNLSTDQTATVWFYDKRMYEDCRLVEEIQMIDFFEMYKEEMRSQILVCVFDKDKCTEEPNYDALEPLAVVPPDSPHEAAGSMHIDPTDPTAVADELEPDREPDMFDNPEEYVGVDDEGMYGSVPPAPQFAQPTDHNANSNAKPNANESENAEFVNVETEVADADPLEVNVLHDPDNPKIAKLELFPDIKTFRKAIRHYAVKTGFEFAARVKTDTTRFIAKCAAPGCPWRIHASTIFYKKTVQVT